MLAANPRERNVRDGLVGLLAAKGDEAQVTRLVEEGRALEPTSALWFRRLAESHLRSGRPGQAAEAFKTASALVGAEPQDLAQWALALELAGNKPGAARAWSDVPPALVSSRSDWVESRARALAPAPTPQVRSATAPALTPDDIRAHQLRVLAERPCAVEPLAVLEGMPESGPFIDAVTTRPVDCGDRALWTSRAVERAIADSAFERALALARPVATAGSPVAIREQLGVLLHWTGARAEAAPILRAVVNEDPGQARATTALIEVLRALGDSEGAWTFAERAWGASGEVEDRISLAELALESGHQEQALTLSRALRADDIVGERAAAVEGRALLNLGRSADARRVLEPLAPSPAASLAWLDAVAATDGVAAALASAARLPIGSSPAWAAVNARRAVWQVRLGHRAEAERLLQAVEAVDPVGAVLTRGEIALATSRPADAERAFRGVLEEQPGHLRALDGLSTALAEQGRWDEALATLSAIRVRRASEVHWEIRMAEWRYRQAPTDVSLDRLRTLAKAHPVPDARSALARACFGAGQYGCALEALGADLTTLSENDAVLAARSLRGANRAAEAVALLRARRTLPIEGMLLRAELLAAIEGPAAARADFEALTSRSDANPDWYLAWADAQRSGEELMRILVDATARFPGDARLQERLAVTAWAARDEGTALRAADAALLADDGRAGAWFVKVEIASGHGSSPELLALLGRFEVRFASEPSARIGMAEMLAGLTRSSDDPAARRALGWVEAILADQPQHAAAAVARARLYAGLNDLPQALRVIDALVAERPELPAALKLKAELLAASGRYEDAVDAFDDYLARAPRDLEARRQQARIEGWRGAYGESLARYERLCASDLQSPAVVAERDAKRAYYRGHWADAVRRYDAWLALEPGNVEAQLERAQALDHLGEAARARDAFGAIAASAAPNDVSLTAADRIGRRQEASVDLFAVAQSADAIERRQLLDLVDSGAGVSDNLGLGYGTRVRVFGGPSMADVGARVWRGNHVGGQFVTSPVAALAVNGSIAYRTLETAGGQWFGDAGLTWRAHATLRLTGGVRAIAAARERRDAGRRHQRRRPDRRRALEPEHRLPRAGVGRSQRPQRRQPAPHHAAVRVRAGAARLERTARPAVVRVPRLQGRAPELLHALRVLAQRRRRRMAGVAGDAAVLRRSRALAVGDLSVRRRRSRRALSHRPRRPQLRTGQRRQRRGRRSPRAVARLQRRTVLVRAALQARRDAPAVSTSAWRMALVAALVARLRVPRRSLPIANCCGSRGRATAPASSPRTAGSSGPSTAATRCPKDRPTRCCARRGWTISRPSIACGAGRARTSRAPAAKARRCWRGTGRRRTGAAWTTGTSRPMPTPMSRWRCSSPRIAGPRRRPRICLVMAPLPARCWPTWPTTRSPPTIAWCRSCCRGRGPISGPRVAAWC